MDFREAIGGAARSWLCRNIQNAQARTDLLDRLTASSRGLGIPVAAVATPINNFGLELFNCPASSGPYPEIPVQPVAGQCDGVGYNVQVRADRAGSTPLTTGVFAVWGPVGDLSVIVDPDGRNRVVFPSRGNFFAPIQPPGTETGAIDGFDTFENPVFTILERRDGQPDNCGTTGPGPGSSAMVPVSYDAPDGTPTNVMVDVSLGDPYLTGNGDIVVPIRVSGPGFEVDVNFSTGTGEPTISPPTIPVDGERCCPSEQPDSDSPPNDEPPPEDSGRVIVGALVTTTSITETAQTTTLSGAPGPRLQFPRVGSVSFGVRKGNSLAWLNPIDIQNRDCYIPCPDSQGAVDVKALPIQGVAFDVKPVYAVISTLDSSD